MFVHLNGSVFDQWMCGLICCSFSCLPMLVTSSARVCVCVCACVRACLCAKILKSTLLQPLCTLCVCMLQNFRPHSSVLRLNVQKELPCQLLSCFPVIQGYCNVYLHEWWTEDSWVSSLSEVWRSFDPCCDSRSKDAIMWPQMLISMQLQLLATRLSLMYSFIPAFPKVYNK